MKEIKRGGNCYTDSEGGLREQLRDLPWTGVGRALP